jgi:hypothetical protein
MGLQDALRKAKGLFIEDMTPEAAQEETPLSAAKTDENAPVDINELLAEKGLGPLARAKNSDASTRAAGGDAPRTVEQIVQAADGPNLDEIKMETPPAPGSDISPQAVYTAAKLPTTPFSAEQMLEMIASLPVELPLETRRQTVKVTFGALGKSVGATPETVVADASRKMAALASYEKFLQKRTDEFAAAAEAEIAALQAQIEEKRKAVMHSRSQFMAATQMCHAESERLDEVLEFFSLDIAPSKYAAAPAGNAPQVNPAPQSAAQRPAS